ncbi:Oxidoreductase [Schizosaccharomyces pombe]
MSEEDTSKLRILSVGSNAISAFISWRLSESKACHTTLIWRNRCESVLSEGIRIRSSVFGSTKWKPDVVAPTVEQLAMNSEPFDYIFVCLKILPSVYNLDTAIKEVVTPGHTCIVLNTTGIVGAEKELQHAFPNNPVLSFVLPDQFAQRGPLQFEHTTFAADSAKSVIYVGLTEEEDDVPDSVQDAMIETLTLTLEAGGVSCDFLSKIQKKQWETGVGHMCFYPLSIINDEPNLALMYRLKSFAKVIDGLMDEAFSIAQAQGCEFEPEKLDVLKRHIVNRMLATPRPSYPYQDYIAHRPLEVAVLLGYPVEIAKELGVSVPRMETLLALFDAKNKRNLTVSAGTPQSSPNFNPAMRRSPVGAASRSPSRSTIGISNRIGSVDDLLNTRQFTSSPIGGSMPKGPNSIYKIPSASMVNLSSPLVTSPSGLNPTGRPSRFGGRVRGNPLTMNKAGSVSDLLSTSTNMASSDALETASMIGVPSAMPPNSFDMLTLTQRRNRRNNQSSSPPAPSDRRYTMGARRPVQTRGMTDSVIPILEDPMSTLYDTSRYPTRNSKPATPKASRPPSIASTVHRRMD